jgi:hypothetical protein
MYDVDGKIKTSHDVEIIRIQPIFKFHDLDLPRVTVEHGDTPRRVDRDRV